MRDSPNSIKEVERVEREALNLIVRARRYKKCYRNVGEMNCYARRRARTHFALILLPTHIIWPRDLPKFWAQPCHRPASSFFAETQQLPPVYPARKYHRS